jgi:hypothetical protein
MTFSSTSVSACEVEDVGAKTGAGAGFRNTAGGSAACWRVAGWMDGAGLAESAVTGFARIALGTTLRAIGRGFGNGTFGLPGIANASDATADNPTASTTPATELVHRNAVARPNGVMTLFRYESSKRARPTSISLKL